MTRCEHRTLNIQHRTLKFLLSKSFLVFIALLGLCGLATAQEGEVEEPVDAGVRETVVITATRTEADPDQLPGRITVIDEEEIDAQPYSNLPDLLMGETGVMVTKNSSHTADAIVEARGFNNGGGNGQGTLVLVDGRRVTTVSGSSTDWASIPLENIERIEIVRGPLTALYGEGAEGAVINIITRFGDSESRAELKAGIGSYDGFDSSLTASGNEDGIDYGVSATLWDTEGYRDRSEFDGGRASLRIGKDLGDWYRVEGKIGVHRDFRQRPGTLTLAEMRAQGRDASTGNPDESELEEGHFDLKWLMYSEAGNRLQVPVTYTQSDSSSETEFVGFGVQVLEAEESKLWLHPSYDGEHVFLGAETHHTFGVDLGFEEANAESVFGGGAPTATDYERTFFGAYWIGEMAISPTFTLTTGVRFDRGELDAEERSGGTTTVDDTFNNVSPAIGFGWEATDNVSFTGGVSRVFRFPSRDELTGFFGVTPKLDPEHGISSEVGTRILSADRRTRIDLAVYWIEMKDEIYFSPPPTGAAVFGENKNFGKIRHQGIEVAIEQELCEWAAVSFSGTAEKVRVIEGDFDGNQIPVTPEWRNRTRLTVEPCEDVMVGLDATYVGGRFLINDLDNEIGRLPSYMVYNANLIWELELGQLEVSVLNFTNRQYFDNGGVGGFPHGSRVGYNPAPELHFWGSFTFRF